jgi:PAS domain S-box-containing protein
MVLDFAPAPGRPAKSILARLPALPGFFYELRGYWDGRPRFSYMSSTRYITGHDVSHWSDDYGAVSELIHPDDLADYDAMRAQARFGVSEVAAEYRERTVDGRYIWVRESARRAVDDAGVTVLTGYCVDITATRGHETAVLERERRLRAVMDAATAQVVEFDLYGRLVYASDAAISGLTGANLARPEAWLAIVSGDRERVRHVVLDAIARRTGCDITFHIVHRDGLDRPIRLLLTYFAGELGSPGWIGVLSDLSAEHEIAERAHAARVQARAVTERTGATLYVWRRGVATVAASPVAPQPHLVVHRDDLNQFHAVHRELVVTRGRRSVDFRWRRHDTDDWRWVRATARSSGDGVSAIGAFLPDDDAIWKEREIERVDGLLTTREREVLAMLSDGLTNRELAHVLSLTEKTISHYVASVLEKLSLPNRAGAAAYSTRLFRASCRALGPGA